MKNFSMFILAVILCLGVFTSCDSSAEKSIESDRNSSEVGSGDIAADQKNESDIDQSIEDNAEVAQIVIDREKTFKEEIDRLHQENPEYNYYYHPVSVVYCSYTLESNASQDALIEKYDMNNAFAGAKVSAYNLPKIIHITFDRDDFTEEIYQKLRSIEEQEPIIKSLSVDMNKDFNRSYMPKIEYYADGAVPLRYEATANVDGASDDKSFIIKTKDEYDDYLSCLSETAELEYQKENILKQKDLYDESFFVKNALVITKIITRPSGSITLTVNNLYIDDNKVYVVVRTDEPVAGTGDMQYTSFTFKVEKTDVMNVDEVITLE